MDETVLQDLLLLVDVEVEPETIAAWTPEQRNQAENWAARSHIAASDNHIPVPARPEFLPKSGPTTRAADACTACGHPLVDGLCNQGGCAQWQVRS